MNDQPEFASPRLQQLNQALQNSDPAAVIAAFWDEIKAQGTPLIETIPDDEAHILATFVYEGANDTQNVYLHSSFTPPPGKDLLRGKSLTRLGGDDSQLWYHTEKLPADLRTTYLLLPNDPRKKSSEMTEEENTAFFPRLLSSFDPHNPAKMIFEREPEIPDDFDVIFSIFEAPQAAPQPHIQPREAVQHGKVELFKFKSTVFANERRLWVYTPPDYDPTVNYGWLLMFDGAAYNSIIPTPTLLDNLLAEGAIPPLVCVMLDSVHNRRGAELTPNEPFISLIRDELMPWVKERYSLSAKPEQAFIGGSSYGGLAAVWVALKCPDLFSNIISQSGSYWWKPGDTRPEEKSADNEPGWLIRQFVKADRQPLKFYMDVGLLENEDAPEGGSQRSFNRHMRDVLRAKGYPVTYVEYNGGHDYVWWRQTLADGLIALQQQ